MIKFMKKQWDFYLVFAMITIWYFYCEPSVRELLFSLLMVLFMIFLKLSKIFWHLRNIDEKMTKEKINDYD